MPRPAPFVIGKVFGKLTVVSFTRLDGRRRYYLCKCVCGNTKEVRIDSLQGGGTQSCGCYMIERTKEANTSHGMTDTPEFMAYSSAKSRCTNPKDGNWPKYGARGVKFLFTSFEQFFSEIGYRPNDGYSLDRKNNDGNYEPGNVRWATLSEQNSNRRTYKRRRKI